ncbi:hypothetical protein CC1G_08583 [Coprinopsis cinerea okayama7|uniref:AA9 family lytic polysaccharide monooxygenase n=1 Tax=Coprinopsis cinerea (strain Okayama-7 / 130 / ATCC MYA-4618 / FGSC 9003) TaxID=240176 RepID=A8NCV0_COPC7|nr:hypothetical protein CC1G_08583 [Coprinopsis cinerea okayama7\|eukprot:XP_001832633.2 hypothetical protein CC1G_08583 [Coprinopsis cinerea okayama7\
MFSILSIALSVTLFIARVAGHGGVQSWIIRDETYIGYQPYDPPEGQWLACNNDGGPTRGGGQISAPIRAGDFIIAVWGYWIHPFGPGMVYMARCPGSCTAVNSTELDWFKIEHTGLIDGNLVDGTWGGGQVVATGIYNATIPEALADGEYLIRHELIALHPQWVGPQFYVECAQFIRKRQSPWQPWPHTLHTPPHPHTMVWDYTGL